MATLTVRNLDEALVRRLRVRAAQNGRSAEAEHREILQKALIDMDAAMARRRLVSAELAKLRAETANPASPTVLELLKESREGRLKQLERKLSGKDED